MQKRYIILSIIIINILSIIVYAQNTQQKNQQTAQQEERKTLQEVGIVESINIFDILIIFALGIIGGLASSILDYQQEGELNWSNLGCNLTLGGIGSFIIYCWGGHQFAPLKRMGTALLAGIGGSHIVALLRKRMLEKETMEDVLSATEDVAEVFNQALEQEDENEQSINEKEAKTRN